MKTKLMSAKEFAVRIAAVDSRIKMKVRQDRGELCCGEELCCRAVSGSTPERGDNQDYHPSDDARLYRAAVGTIPLAMARGRSARRPERKLKRT